LHLRKEALTITRIDEVALRHFMLARMLRAVFALRCFSSSLHALPAVVGLCVECVPPRFKRLTLLRQEVLRQQQQQQRSATTADGTAQRQLERGAFGPAPATPAIPQTVTPMNAAGH
jgi:hypothetical protein